MNWIQTLFQQQEIYIYIHFWFISFQIVNIRQIQGTFEAFKEIYLWVYVLVFSLLLYMYIMIVFSI